MYKLKRYFTTKQGRKRLSIVGIIFLVPFTALFILFGTNAVVDTEGLDFVDDKSRYSWNSVMKKVQLYKDGVFNVKIVEEEESSTEPSTQSKDYDPYTSPSSNSTGSNYIMTTTSGGGKLVSGVPSCGIPFYDGPTRSGKSYEIVLSSSEMNLGSWCTYEESKGRYATSIVNQSTLNHTGDVVAQRNDYVSFSQEGRVFVALGPGVTDPNFVATNTGSIYVQASEIVYHRVDAVVTTKDGSKEYYIPLASGDVKAHTFPTGIYQSGLPVHMGGAIDPAYPNYTNWGGKQVVEWITRPGSAGGIIQNEMHANYNIKKLIVYME